MQNKRTPAANMALGGVLAALAVVTMSLGTLIPVATYVCPVACCILLELVRKICGSRTAWAWYGAVAVLSLLMAPDKEAAAVFAALGYYPILKVWFDRRKGMWLWKLLYFNTVILLLYWLLMHLFGFNAVAEEFAQAGALLTAVTLLMGNVLFFLLDRLLDRKFRKR